MPEYQFLTNHAQVLLCVAHDPGIRLRDIAQTVGVTERSAHRIVSQLVDDGYVVRERMGRRNVYKVKPELPLRHPLTQEIEERRIGDLLEVLLGEDGRGRPEWATIRATRTFPRNISRMAVTRPMPRSRLCRTVSVVTSISSVRL